jgi:putative transposase
MLVLKTFQYRLYPTKDQQHLLTRQLEECRWLWNTLLAERKTAWEERHESVEYYEQQAELPWLKAAERPFLQQVHSQVLQDVVLRLKKAFDAFFRRLKAGEEPGYPRFRGVGRYDRLTFPQVPSGCALNPTEKRLTVSKVGRIKVLLHRTLEGIPKTATIRRTATGKWFVAFACEWEPPPLPPSGRRREVGLDVGHKVFAMPSQGKEIENPRFFRAEERGLARAQRKHLVALDTHMAICTALTAQMQAQPPDLDARQVWQTVSQHPAERVAWRERRRWVVARGHERIRWRRSDCAHQESRKLVDQYDLLAVEDLSVRNMVRTHALAKSIHDAAWTQFACHLACKAAWAGRRWVAVDPKQTSQTCSGCGWRNPTLTLADRVFHCLNPARPDCHLVLDWDRNAARNILAWGKDVLALGRQCLPSG